MCMMRPSDSAGAVMAPIISVVIPTYNSAHWIARTMASIVHQRFRAIEILVIDDGSTDDLPSVLKPFVDRDPRIRIIRQENRGLAGARNRGIMEARAEFVATIDADDLWHPDFLTATYAALNADPSAPFAFAYSFRITEDDRVLRYIRPRTPPRHDLVGLLSLNSVGSGSAGLFRKDALEAVGGFDEAMGKEGLHGAEDWKLALRLAHRGTPVLVPRHLVAYRLVATSMSQRNPMRQLRAIQAVIRDMRIELPHLPSKAFRDGQTMMTAWLLPTFAYNNQWADFFREMARGYGNNPFWFTNPLLRRAHWYRVLIVAGVLMNMTRLSRRPLPSLRDIEMDGERPFSYLEL